MDSGPDIASQKLQTTQMQYKNFKEMEDKG
jgi:hypothetical protein